VKNTHHVTDDYGKTTQHRTSREAHAHAKTQVNPKVEVRDPFGRVVSSYRAR
jgi:hypothetical protein